jgi:hypothetical protein
MIERKRTPTISDLYRSWTNVNHSLNDPAQQFGMYRLNHFLQSSGMTITTRDNQWRVASFVHMRDSSRTCIEKGFKRILEPIHKSVNILVYRRVDCAPCEEGHKDPKWAGFRRVESGGRRWVSLDKIRDVIEPIVAQEGVNVRHRHSVQKIEDTMEKDAGRSLLLRYLGMSAGDSGFLASFDLLRTMRVQGQQWRAAQRRQQRSDYFLLKF